MAAPGTPDTTADAMKWLAPRGRTLLIDFRTLTDQRAAAAALAVRLFAADHDGRYPNRIEDLVPNYLPRAPADPFAADGRALRLTFRDDKPLIYSVAENGTDEGGDETLIPLRSGIPGVPPSPPMPPANVIDIVGTWGSFDAVYHLSHRTRQPERDETTTAPSRPAEGFQ